MSTKKLLHTLFLFFMLGLVLFAGCTKNPNPTPPVTDTVTVTKTDTLIKIDTLYATKPDSTVNLTKGLLLYLNFSGNIVDSSGNNNQTTAIGSVLTYDEHGYANSAFGSDGSEKIYVANNGSIVFDTAWALSLAFMVNDIRNETYISMIDPATGYGPSFNFGNAVAGFSNLACGSGDISTDCGGFEFPSNLNIVDTTAFIPVPGSWYKAIVIYHRGTLQIYINGTLISTKVGSGTQALLCPNSQVIIGSWWNSDPQGLNGKLDNIRLYNRVLTPHEIVTLSSNYQITSNSAQRPVRTH